MARLAQNTANHGIAAPLLIVQGLADVVVPPPATHAYVAERCAAGQRLEYWTFAGLDHGCIDDGCGRFTKLEYLIFNQDFPLLVLMSIPKPSHWVC